MKLTLYAQLLLFITLISFSIQAQDKLINYHLYSDSQNQLNTAAAFSGGGSRSLTASMGQLQALKDLGLFNKDNPNRIREISATSGGAWAAGIFVYYSQPNEPDLEQDDHALLGSYTEPRALYWEGIAKEEANLSYLPRNRISAAALELSPENLIGEMLAASLLGTPDHLLWSVSINELVLKPYKLHDTWDPIDGYNKRFIGGDIEWFNQHIGDIDISKFLLRHEKKPQLTITTAIFPDHKAFPTLLLPIEVNPSESGMAGRQKMYGGLLHDAYALHSKAPIDEGNGIASVKLGRYSLTDALGTSSAFFSTLFSNLDDILSKSSLTTKDFNVAYKYLQSNHNIKFNSKAKAQFEKLVVRLRGQGKPLSSLIPQYQYWGERELKQMLPAKKHKYADGGNLENIAITPLLRKKYGNIYAFINTADKLVEDTDGEIYVDESLSALFGYTPLIKLQGDDRKRYHLYDDLTHDELEQISPQMRAYQHNQVFPSKDFHVLLELLHEKNSQDGTLYSGAAIAKQPLVTVENERFDIEEGHQVDVTWYYLTRDSQWHENLSIEVAEKMDSEFFHFPNFSTFNDIQLTPQKAKLLSNFTSWQVRKNKDVYLENANHDSPVDVKESTE